MTYTKIDCPEFRKLYKAGKTFNIDAKEYWKFDWHEAAYEFKYCPFCGKKLA